MSWLKILATQGSTAASVWRYQPLVPVAVAFACGVTLDRHMPCPATFWLVSAALTILVWVAAANRHRWRRAVDQGAVGGWARSFFLLVAITLTGAAWNHVYWNAYPADDIGHWAHRNAGPVRLRGVLIEEPLVVRADRREPLRVMRESTHSLTGVAVSAIELSTGWTAASGRAHVVVDGELSDLHAGDSVDVLGDLIAPAPASNPGEFDYKDHLRGRRARAVLRCKQADGVRKLGELPASGVGCWFERLAGAAERRLAQRLSPEQSKIATALLLGRYELMEEDVTELFVRTGTMHILAISGQHLGILAAFLWFLLRVLLIPRKLGAVALGAVVVVYALLTGARPPMLRAAVLVAVLVGAILFDCRSRRANALALTAIIVMVLNPSDLFDRGFQLSFLAVAALFWVVQPAWSFLQGAPDPLDQLLTLSQPAWQRMFRAARRWFMFALVTSTVVWLANVPLLAARFHLISPIVIPLTVILTPVVTVALISGLGLLLLDPWAPGLGTLLATICGWSVSLMEWCVRFGSHVPGGYWYVPGPPDWWLGGLYLGLTAMVLVPPLGRARLYCITAGAAWLAVGLAVPSFRPPPGHLECRLLAVGNGAASVLRLPDGRTVLVDAGQITGPRVGSRLIAPALWDAGITRIDAVFISHADVDHFNGLPDLVERFSVASVFIPPHFAHSDQEGVRMVCDLLGRRGIPVRITWADDRFELGYGVVARVLHPPAEFDGSDNEQSLVLAIDYLGKRILIAGDIEGAGLRRLLDSEPMEQDVLVAPHHGSRKANPPELVAWSRPKLVLVSQGKPRSGATLDAYRHAGIPVLTTNEHGAITIELDESGLRVRAMR